MISYVQDGGCLSLRDFCLRHRLACCGREEHFSSFDARLIIGQARGVAGSNDVSLEQNKQAARCPRPVDLLYSWSSCPTGLSELD